MNEKKLINLEEIELTINSPNIYSEYSQYVTLLSKVVDEKNVKNIGIVAPYGAGKSSLITSYIYQKQNTNKHFDKKVITVSLANYTSITKQTYTGEKEIEKSILQQLFYKNDGKKTPSSRFSHLKNLGLKNAILSILISVLIFLTGVLSLIFIENKQNINNLWKNLNFKLFGIILFILVSFLIFFLIKFKLVKKVGIGSLNIEKKEKSETSVFNEYLDEIMYFFQKNEFNILVIEDLDRFDNLQIFSKLKELNTLLNNNDKIIKKHGKITFIYAVKDSMFNNEEERSKFFEFIIPIIPSITSDNVKDELQKTIKNKIGRFPLSDNVVIDLCDYITSRRILNNVVNDFLINMSLLKLENTAENQAELDKLFSLMVLKNKYPIEYELLQKQSEHSIINNLLTKQKELLIKKSLEDVNIKINNYQKELNSINKTNAFSIEELKLILIGCIVKDGFFLKEIVTHFDSFEKIDNIIITYIDNKYYSQVFNHNVSIKNMGKRYFNNENYFYNTEINFKNKTSDKLKFLQNELENLYKEKNDLLSMKFCELYEYYKETNEELDFSKPFYKVLLVNGYIDENYMDYLSIHDESFITKNDHEIIKKINRKEKLDTLEIIDNPKKLILSLKLNSFYSKYIINFYLLKELFLSNLDCENKKNYALNYLRDNFDSLKKLFNDILLSNIDYYEFFAFILKNVKTTWKSIYINNNISNIAKSELIFKALNDGTLTQQLINELNIDKCITNTINEITEFGNRYKNQFITIQELNAIIDIKIDNLNNFNKNEINEFLLKNNCYKINFNNVSEILKTYYNFNLIDIKEKNYDVVMSDSEGYLKSYIESNIEDYCVNIYNSIESGRLSPSNLLKLLENNNISLETKLMIVQKESSIIDYSEKLDISLVKSLLEKKQINISIDYLEKIYNNLPKDLVILYVNENSDKLDINTNFLDKDKNFMTFLFEECNLSLFCDRLEKNHYLISDFSASVISILIENGCTRYEKNDFVNLLSNNTCLLNYCEKYENEIITDLEKNRIILNSEQKIILYKCLNHTNELFKHLIKQLSVDNLNEIILYDSGDKIVSDTTNVSSLSIECRKYLLSQNISNSSKEIIICTFTDFQAHELYDIINETFKLKNGEKYKYTNEKFYKFLLNKNVVSNRKKGYMYFTKTV